MSAYVVFFGGYQATKAEIDHWTASAQTQKPLVTFNGHPYPSGATADGDSAIKNFKKAGGFDAVVAAIESCSSEVIYIVGHSSGCAIANAVDRSLKDTRKVVLVALDGYAPSHAQLERRTTQVWSADCGDPKSSDYATSLHYDGLKKAAGARFKVYHARDCYTKWALHFSLVNRAANDKAVKRISQGYAHCQANLMWM